MLAEDDAFGGEANVFGFHDLVGLAVLEHAVLVDPGFVGEGIASYDRLVARRRAVGDLRQRAAGVHDPRGIDVGGHAERVGAGLQGHDDILERAIAGALTDAVDGAFDLPRAAANRR